MGINEAGFESGNADITEGRDLPWLQDTDADDVWNTWPIVYRDVVVLNGDNTYANRLNLTDNDLADPDTYDTLRTMLEQASAR